MANFFSLQDGNLTDISVYGYSLTGTEITNNTTGTMLLTSTNLYSASVNSDGSVLSAVALNLSARTLDPTGTLGLTIQNIASAGSFIDSSSNNLTITTVGSAYQNMFTPFSPNGWSGYFNGTTNYLTILYNSAFLLGTGAFTIESWIYLNTTTGDNAIISKTSGFIFEIKNGKVSFWDGGTNYTSTTTSLSVGRWYHVAAVREGTGTNQFKFYLNGFIESSFTLSLNDTNTSNITVGSYGPSHYFNGFLSNLRLIKGTALYTSNFTPSTTPLTNISNTSLLTLQDNRFKDNSNNNFLLSAVGSVSIKDTNPFTITPINRLTHGGSGYFGGTYLTVTSQPSLSFGTGDFTVEAWIYPQANLGQYEAICAGTTSDGFSLQTQVANNNIICITTSVANVLASNTPLLLNQWNHVAATRSSGVMMIYINGLSSARAVNNTSFGSITYIGGGGYIGGGNILKNSYISNFRAIKGTALYTTASFTPSSFSLTNIAGTSLLLNTNNYGTKNTASETYGISSFTSFDGSNNLLTNHPQNWQILKLTNPLSTNIGDVITYSLSTSNPSQLSLVSSRISATDITGVTRLSTVGTPLLTSFKPYPNFDDSYFLNGTTDWFTVPANPRFALDGDFTIECWINTSTFSLNTVARKIFTFGADNANNIQMYLNTSNGIVSLFGSSDIITGTLSAANGNWNHLAVSRYNNLMRLYVNGVQSGPTTTNTTNINAGVTNPLTIGAYNNTATGRINGYINNFRIVNGTAVYTTSSFTPPTEPLPVVTNTVFLMKNGARYNQALISNEILKTGNLILNGTQLSSANPFGSGLDSSIRFNGNGDYIKVLYQNSNWSITNYSLECWFYWTGGTGQQRIFSNPTPGLQLCLNIGGIWGLFDGLGGPSFGSSPSKNVWHHLYINRSSGTLRAFLNGNQIFTGTNSPNILISDFTIGGEANNSHSFGGFLSNLRISNKPFYTPINDTITIPTRPLDPTDIVNNGANFLINTNSYNLSSFYYFDSLNDIHIGGSLKSLNSNFNTVTANTITLDNLYIHNQGTLTFPLTSNVTLNINGSAGLQITSDGTLNIGTSSSSIPLSTTHTIILSNTQIDVHNGGNLNVYGYPKLTTTSLVSTHSIGSRTFTTTNNISSDWKVGDILSFKPNLSSRRSFDELVLSSFTGSNIFTTTLSSLCTHTGSADSFAFIPDVYNLSRNVTIQGSTSANRGTIRIIDAAKTIINYAQLSNFGINSLNKNGLVIGNNLSGSTTLSGITILSDNQSYIRNIISLTGRSVQNLNITNSTVNKSNLLLSSLSVNNVVFSNNYILSSNQTGLQVNDVSGSNINMNNNTTIGSLSYGTFLVNNTLTGTYGALNYNSGLQGVMVSGTNTGTVVGGSINSARDGVYANASTYNLSGLTFQNILASNNTLDGFTVSGNNLNYLTPVTLNINGLTANNNNDTGFECYNIIGNISSLSINTNVNNIKTSIGNGITTFDGLTSLVNNTPRISSGITFLNSPSAVLSLSAPSYSGPTEGSLYFTGSSYALLPTVVPNLSSTFTLEGWIYIQNYPTSTDSHIAFLYDSASNRSSSYNSIIGIRSTGSMNLYFYQGGAYNITSTSAIQLSTWTHFAFCVSGYKVNYYINGVNVTPVSNTITPLPNNTNLVNIIGAALNTEPNEKFYISNYRISNNLRYTSNFTVPPYPIPNVDSNTLLLYQYPYNNTFFIPNIYSGLNVNILSGYNYSKFVIRNSHIGQIDTYPSLNSYLIMDSVIFSNFSLENSVVTGIGSNNSIRFDTTRNLIEGSYLFNNCYLGSINFIDLNKYQPNIYRTAGFGFTNYNKISGNHFTYLPMGVKLRDTLLYDNSTSDLVSERLTPTSRTLKLKSGSKYVALNSGESTSVKVNVLVSSNYNGNLPRLMLRGNPAAGINNDTVIGVFNPSFGYDIFTEIIGNETIPVIDNCILEFYVDCDGTQGYVCVDTWTAN